MKTEELSFPRYLAAKKSVDDRSLNRHVWAELRQAMVCLETEFARPLRVLEIGAGIGTMLERLLAWDLLPQFTYTAIDVQAENIVEAKRRLKAWTQQRGWTWTESGGAEPSYSFVLRRPGNSTTTPDVRLDLQVADLFDFAQQESARGAYNLLIAHAVLDLLPLPDALTPLLGTLGPGGICYFTLTFDGVTSFQPTLDPDLDDQIERFYHRTMDERLVDGKPSGDHRSGRHLLFYLQRMGVDLLAAGSSDWIVYPRHGGYPEDEAYFLRFILHFFETSLATCAGLDPDAFRHWLQIRHHQIDAGELIFLAHQLDLVGRVGYPPQQ